MPITIHGTGIFNHIYLYEWLIFMVNVGKYTSPMDGMGVWDGSCGVELNPVL